MSRFLASITLVAAFAMVARADELPKEIKALEVALEKAGKNRKELEDAIDKSSKETRKGMQFLIAHMPDGDLKTLKADFLLENAKLAYDAKAKVPWGKDIPEDLFFNNVLPYANLDESRDPWRKELFDLAMPIIEKCKTAAEATELLNKELFPKLKVKYSTKRKAPNQSPKESIETGLASCTGLSILLSDACRAVAIPTRVVGTPLWSNKRGNHTWLEIWDGDWHFTGACEPDKLDRGWFVGDASQAKKDVPEHAIYAASFAKTKSHFPLVWAPDSKTVHAENVTDRYAKKEAIKADVVRVFIRATSEKKQRIAIDVIVEQPKKKGQLRGTTKAETADTNDFLTFELAPEADYILTANGQTLEFKTGKGGTSQTVEVKGK